MLFVVFALVARRVLLSFEVRCLLLLYIVCVVFLVCCVMFEVCVACRR